ncbi:unnamed protein product [Fusarium fujikuroi]|nr:unnamed protein product [Fusarium fujikuroi]
MNDHNIGIVGAGVAGLYSALLLQEKGYTVKIFEAADRVGGRVQTHHFTTDENQYYEAGVMRIPVTKLQDTIFSLIRYVNSHERLPQTMAIRLIDYICHHEGNYSYFGSTISRLPVTDVTPASAGWIDVPEPYQNRSAGDLLNSALEELTQGLDNDFNDRIERIVKNYDQCTLRCYLIEHKNWPPSVVSFLEATLFYPNAFSCSIIDACIKNLHFSSKDWKTIDQGMSRLTDAMAYLVRHENITLGANITELIDTDNQRVAVKAKCSDRVISAEFDRVILAIPPPALRSITNRPCWSTRKELAIHSLIMEPAYKEQLSSRGSIGGQSETDLPIRLLMYPSYSMGTSGPGVLILYPWSVYGWPKLDPPHYRAANKIDVHKQFIEASEILWSESTGSRLTAPRPGHLSTHLKWAGNAKNNIFFAGGHLSYYYDWILGAALSAVQVVKDILQADVQPLSDVSMEKESRS